MVTTNNSGAPDRTARQSGLEAIRCSIWHELVRELVRETVAPRLCKSATSALRGGSVSKQLLLARKHCPGR